MAVVAVVVYVVVCVPCVMFVFLFCVVAVFASNCGAHVAFVVFDVVLPCYPWCCVFVVVAFCHVRLYAGCRLFLLFIMVLLRVAFCSMFCIIIMFRAVSRVLF